MTLTKFSALMMAKPRLMVWVAVVLAAGLLWVMPAVWAQQTDAPIDASGVVVPRDDDPAKDGWDTEVFNNAAGSQLKKLGKLLGHPEKIDAAHLAPLATDEVTCSPLRPAEVAETFKDGAIRALRAVKPGDEQPGVPLHHGIDGLGRALRFLAEPFAGATDFRVKIKIIHINVDDRANEITSQKLVAISGRLEGGSVEGHATWDCTWQPASGDDPPRLKSIVMSDYIQVEVRAAGRTLFSDCTQAVLGGNDALGGQFMVGTNHWLDRHERLLAAEQGAYFGLAVGDVNGDDLDDVYICQAGGLPNRLFIQNADGTASDRSQWAKVDWLDDTKSALLIDLDNDGDCDLVLGTAIGVLTMSNDGQGRFTALQYFQYLDKAFSMAAADYDLDGDLDLFVCRYDPDHLASGSVPNPVPFYDANNGADNRLLRNDGNLLFTDVTKAVGLDEDNRRFSLAAVWEDYDNDGDPDLYVANDFGRNCLYRNDDGHFVNIADQAGVEDHATGMSACFGDYDRDGLMDLYVGNMWSSAGKRITDQSQFRPDMEKSKKMLVRRLSRGNSLFRNRGADRFDDVSLTAAVDMGRWSWSSLFVDINSDGWEDLVVSNGFVSTQDSGDL